MPQTSGCSAGCKPAIQQTVSLRYLSTVMPWRHFICARAHRELSHWPALHYSHLVMAIFYDTHAHLDYPDFADDFTLVLERAKSAGIAKMICIGTSFESSRRAIALAEAHEEIFAVVGWHPS